MSLLQSCTAGDFEFGNTKCISPSTRRMIQRFYRDRWFKKYCTDFTYVEIQKDTESAINFYSVLS
jgi:hypothetical protein